MAYIGIDLGTTFSCVGIWRNGGVEILSNNNGARTTPSYVCFDENKRPYVGQEAKNRAMRYPLSTLYDSKRMLGKSFDDETIQSDAKTWSFNISNNDGKPNYVVNGDNISPEQISAFILSEMKRIALLYVDDIAGAVVTCPAYFNNAQKEATENACKIAKINLVRIISEPTAAAFAYGLNKLDESNILVFDCGGGTHDVTVLNLSDGIFTVLATNGDSHLGGQDFDTKIMEYCISQDKSLMENKKTMQKLRAECVKAKHTLSNMESAEIEVDDFYCTLTRRKFEELCEDLFIRTMNPVLIALEDSKLSKTDINEIILVGGSTRIIKIKQLLSNLFDGKKLHEGINADEAVAYGAAVQAAILNKVEDEKLDSIVLLDVTPLTLGIEARGGVMSSIIDRNSKIPCSENKIYTTNSDNQTSVFIKVYEGERPLTKDNTQLGEFELTGIKPASRGHPKIHVKFELDANGILKVSAKESCSTDNKELIISRKNVKIEDIDRQIKEAEKYAEIDNYYRELSKVKFTLENILYTHKSSNKAKIIELLEIGRELYESGKTDEINAFLLNFNDELAN